MIVVADSSPFILLLNIGHIEVLPQLFNRVVIPPAVAAELLAPSRPQSVRDFITAPPVWLAIQRPTTLQQIPHLHPGESEALSLAIEIRADLLLIDERTAYREAVARNLNAIGTIRVLERARRTRPPRFERSFPASETNRLLDSAPIPRRALIAARQTPHEIAAHGKIVLIPDQKIRIPLALV